MFKVMIRCDNIRAEDLAKILGETFSGFKVWLHENRTYASFRLRSLDELTELRGRLAEMEVVQCGVIKIEKVSRFWRS